MSQQTKQYTVLFILLILGIATRFLFLLDDQSFLANFTAVGAIAIFGAFYFDGPMRYMAPLAVLWVSDLVLNNVVYAQYYDSFQLFGSASVYAAVLVVGIVAYFMMRSPSWTRLLGTSLVGAVIFFVMTNAVSWYANPMYTQDLSGLMASYTAGIPFFRNTLISNVVFSFVLFGVYEYILSPSLALRREMPELA